MALAIIIGGLGGMLWLVWNYSTQIRRDGSAGRLRDDPSKDTHLTSD
jgi:hypothetical protein